ncbi:MAG: phage terminase large subunit [Clostridium sp.]
MNINVKMNPCFKEVDRSTKRYIVMKGSAGSGKSVDTAQNYIIRLMRDKGRNLVCIRKSDITNRDSTFAELTGAIYKMLGDKSERYWQITKSPLKLTCRANGNEIIFRGMNDDKQREKLKSITFQKGETDRCLV